MSEINSILTALAEAEEYCLKTKYGEYMNHSLDGKRIFRYKSDSDNLSDELQNKWLIGWSGDKGGTFSQFDEYALYEKKTPEKTLKYIKKKLIG